MPRSAGDNNAAFKQIQHEGEKRESGEGEGSERAEGKAGGLMAARSIENQIAIDSFNRDAALYPDAADFVVSLGKRQEAYQVVLTSLEMPNTAWLIEREWSTLEYDLGLQTPHALAEQPYRCLTRMMMGGAVPETRALLPPPFAAVTVVSTAASSFVVELQSGLWHGLTTRSLHLLARQVYVYGGKVTPSSAPPCEVIGVLSESRLEVNGPVLDLGQSALLCVSGGGPNTFASPRQLVDVLNANLAERGWLLRMSFDPVSIEAELKVPESSTEHYVVDSTSQLFRFLGFSSAIGVISPRSFPLRSRGFPLGRLKGELTPGNYELGSFKFHLESTLNPQLVTGVLPAGSFSILQGNVARVVTLPATGPQPGVCFCPLPSGEGYHPEALARALQLRIEEAYSSGGYDGGKEEEGREDAGVAARVAAARVAVSFDESLAGGGAFVFTSVSPTGGEDRHHRHHVPFTIDWGPTENDQKIATSLGFDHSVMLLPKYQHVGAPRSFVSTPMAVTMPLWREKENISSNRRFFFSVKQRAPTTLSVQVAVDGGDLLAEVGACAIGVLLHSDDTDCYVYVSGKRDGRLRLEALVPSLVLPSRHPGSYHPVPYVTAGLNFYFPDVPRTRWNRLAEILGFTRGVASLDSNGQLAPPNGFTLEPPSYVLLDIELNHFSSNFLHRAGSDVLQTLMGKIVLFANFRYERTSGVMRLGTGVSYVSDLRIRLLTPWHTLWPLHGKNWSATLVFGSTLRSVNTEVG